MRQFVSIQLAAPAHEMAQEEILKKVCFVSRAISDVTFEDGGSVLVFETDAELADEHSAEVRALAAEIQRSLRNLQRRIWFTSRVAENPSFQGSIQISDLDGVTQLGEGQVAFRGIPLKLFRYFDRVFEQMGQDMGAIPLSVPALIPATVLAKCSYFSSFPHSVTFAAHLREDAKGISGFKQRHQGRAALDEQALGDMATPEACLTPALCYHVYHLHERQNIPSGGAVYGLCGKCFRYESGGMTGLRRLWDFTMREIVFLGSGETVLDLRERGMEAMAGFMDAHEISGEIRTASDPFFIGPDAASRMYFQLSSGSKYEVALKLPEGASVAASSYNYHSDFFGTAFDVKTERGDAMHSACIGFGLERWVGAFLAQHGSDPSAWPAPVRCAREFAE